MGGSRKLGVSYLVCRLYKLVMPGLVPGIHVLVSARKDVDGRDKPGHDDVEMSALPLPKRVD